MRLFLIFAPAALAPAALASFFDVNYRVAIEGNVIFGTQTLDSQRLDVRDKLEAHCNGIGARVNNGPILTGGFDNQGYHFRYECNCARGDVKTPYEIHIDSWWSAQVTRGPDCTM